ncbi:MAG: hypothetical protein H6721_26670 [Sandaracinus sp.]|nr:hypothetical protein [Sandaracinus sp.]MCB9620498.1 hypothetical protein [Sandaracinus sp.]MCB9635718.1 hypothetical protein [Sandaracinus sp.]
MTTGALQLEIAGERIETWASYRVSSSMLTPADDWSASLFVRGDAQARALLASYVRVGEPVKAYIVQNHGQPDELRALQLTGFVETRDVANDINGTRISVSGRDLAAHLADSCVPMDAVRQTGENFVDLVRALVAPWRIEVWLDAAASRHIATGQVTTTAEGRLARQRARRLGVPAGTFNRAQMDRATRERVPIDEVLGAPTPAAERAARRARKGAANALTASDIQRIKIAEAMPQAGEVVWEFLERHARRFGLMMWFDPEGRLVISSPNYDQPPTFRIVRRLASDPQEPNNVLAGSEQTNMRDRYSKVTVFGKTGARDASRSKFSFAATDSTLPFPKELVVHDQSVRSREEAKRAATRELYKFRANAHVLDYTLRGHGDGSHVFATDATYEIHDEVLGIYDTWYCVERTFSCSRDQGTSTTLRLLPLGALQL